MFESQVKYAEILKILGNFGGLNAFFIKYHIRWRTPQMSSKKKRSFFIKKGRRLTALFMIQAKLLSDFYIIKVQ